VSTLSRRTTLLLIALTGAVVLKALVGALEAKLVFFPYKGEDANPGALGIPYAAITLTTSDGERIAAWQLEPGEPIADVVYFHGNGGNLSVWMPALASLHAMGLRVLAIDYRGYGLSSGSPSEEGVYRDAEAAVRYAAGHRAAHAGVPLIFWGRSLGGPIAAAATHAIAPDGLILESTFADKAAVIRAQPLLRVLNLFAAYRFPTVEMLRQFSGPVLVMHGDRDSIVPYAVGQELYERLRGPKQFARIPGADHNDFFDASRESYWKPVVGFVAGLGKR
jgi:fermentation-respiration switch protein FrsA (DUF1100 family)